MRGANRKTFDALREPIEHLLAKKNETVQISELESLEEMIQDLTLGQDEMEQRIERNAVRMAAAEGHPLGMYGTYRNITPRKQLEEALVRQKRRFEQILTQFPFGICIVSGDHQMEYTNPVLNKEFGDFGGRKCYEYFHDFSEPCAWCNNKRTLQGDTVDWEWHASKSNRDYVIVAIPLHNDDGTISKLEVFRDITERKRAEADREKLQSQLIQAQKLESVGRLAGGVAHDFNNMLSVILGYSELALDKVKPSDPLHADIKEIYTAAKKSAEITRQLLAFARRQTISPQTLDLNATVEAMLKMLRRLIGEDIDLVWQPGAILWAIRMDPSQIDQILANLCVNARDAIGGEGKLSIETGNVRLDEGGDPDGAKVASGDYVMLVVSDNGCGMDKETLNYLFDPFFTAKAAGKGTGLGMATVYGIVKQNNGTIDVFSEPGRGATFKIYLPRFEGESDVVDLPARTEIPKSQGETVLIVEDEAVILKIAKGILEQLDYQVLGATSPGQAMELTKAHAGKIHLLITDVVMPEMNGRVLAEKIKALYPDLKVLFMSGYTADVIADRGVLEEGVSFIQKPFSKGDLGLKVRETLTK